MTKNYKTLIFGVILEVDIYWILLKIIFQNKTEKMVFIELVALLYSNFGKRCEE